MFIIKSPCVTQITSKVFFFCHCIFSSKVFLLPIFCYTLSTINFVFFFCFVLFCLVFCFVLFLMYIECQTVGVFFNLLLMYWSQESNFPSWCNWSATVEKYRVPKIERPSIHRILCQIVRCAPMLSDKVTL